MQPFFSNAGVVFSKTTNDIAQEAKAALRSGEQE